MKPHVDIISDDAEFIQLCREHLRRLNCACRYFSSQVNLDELLIGRSPGDIVVIHKQVPDDVAVTILDVLKYNCPDVRVIVVSDSDDFWNDFRYWIADDCRIIRRDLAGLSGSLERLIFPEIGGESRLL